MTKERLVALASGYEMGYLERSGQSVIFEYAPTWQEAQNAYPLSLSLPLEQSTHRTDCILPFLWGLLPDNRDVLERWGRNFGVSPRNPFRVLAHVGEDCAGAVQFVVPDRVETILLAPFPEPHWINEKELAQRLRLLTRDASAGRLARDHGQFSLPGAQAKTALFFDGKRWGIPAGRTPTTHILKPPIAGFDGHLENEHYCLQLARALGLSAAESRVTWFEDQPAIVVTRYDRIRQADGTVVRIHQEDGCQALGIHPDVKYENQGGPGARTILETLRENSRDPLADEFTFLRALIFNWLIGGTDAHAKNFAFLFAGGMRVRLAPLYDVASVLPYYPTETRELKVAMQIGGEYLLMRIGWASWRRFAKTTKTPLELLRTAIRDMAAELPDRARDIEKDARREGLKHPIISTLTDILSKRARHCLRQQK